MYKKKDQDKNQQKHPESNPPNKQRDRIQTKDSRKALKQPLPPPSNPLPHHHPQPPPNNPRQSHQRLGTGQSNRFKQDQQTQTLLSFIKEYLQKIGYSRTVSIMQNEKLNKKPVKQEPPQQQGEQHVDSLLICFEKGQREEFFGKWNKWFSGVQDLSFKKLEFELHIYFYIYPIHPEYRKNSNAVIDQQSVQQFKKYLENKGSDLSRTTEFLSFYALPYIQKPQEHPAISHVFTKEWLLKLKKALHEFLKVNSKNQIVKGGKLPTLQAMYRSSKEKEKEKQKGGGEGKHEERFCDHEEDINLMKEQNESLIMYVNNLQENYKEVLEISKANMMESQLKWFHFSKDIFKLIKKIHKQDKQQDSNKIQGKIKQLTQFFNRDIEELFITKDISIFQKNSITQSQSHPSIISRSPLSPSRKTIIKPTQSIIPLNISKILQYLSESHQPQNQIGAFLVLQALRWRFTKTKNPALRRQILTNYSINDVCMITKPNWKIQEILLFKSPAKVKICYLRLLNYITSYYIGINYINKETKLIVSLIKIFKNQEEDNSIKKHSLGVLQKLSLLRQPQEIMLKQGMLEQIIKLLNLYHHQQHHNLSHTSSYDSRNNQRLSQTSNNLSDYTIQYLTALLMNLSLRKLKRPQLNQHKKQLALLTYNYLLTDNIQVKNYINGTLYSFLEISTEFREEVLKVGMLERIEELMGKCEERLFQHQYQLIHDKLVNQEEIVGEPEESEEEEGQGGQLEYDLDDEEENDLVDDDKSSECYEWEEEYLNGEELLIKEFPLLGPEGMKDQMLTKSMMDENMKKNNVSSISRGKRGNEAFGGGRPVTPSLNGGDNELEKSLIKYSRV